jgi:hypothetical protein
VIAVRTGGKVPQADGADFVERVRVLPNIKEAAAAYIAGGKRKLDAGINVTVRRNIAGGVSGAARDVVQDVGVSICG